MIIRVTQKDIDQGQIGVAYCCPVALALAAFGFHKPCVSRHKVIATWNDAPQIMENAPRSVARFVSAFDQGQPVKPFKFRFSSIV